MKSIFMRLSAGFSLPAKANLWVCTFVLSALHTNTAFGEQTVGDWFENATGSGIGVYGFIDMVSKVFGAGLIVFGLLKITNKNQRDQGNGKQAGIMIGAGIALVAWQFLAGGLAATFGGNEVQLNYLTE